MRSNWIAWGITIGEGILLLGFGVVLGEYWLMLPVWMRSTAGVGLGMASVILAYRFFKFRRRQKRVAPGKMECGTESKRERAGEPTEASL
jgi:hypothetical protein